MDSYSCDGLSLDVTDTGPESGRTVIALHGFPADRHCWDGVAAHLTANGYRVLAPDQRGYSPSARPAERARYARARLVDDVLALADAAGRERFDLIGHDWGGVVAWDLAAHHPGRVRSLAVLSTPHPAAFRSALFSGGQLLRSWYMAAFCIPRLPEAIFRWAGPERVAAGLTRDGVDPASALRYAERVTRPGAMTGPLNWYRALPHDLSRPVPKVEVPVLYLWGDHDRYLARAAAEATSRWVRGPYRFEVLEGAGHWLPEVEAQRLAAPLLAHLDGAR